jgi:subtilisin-like proprotein convertase family protein
VFGGGDIDAQNHVTVTGGVWNGETEVLDFTQNVGANGMSVNADDVPGGKDLTTLAFLVISDDTGKITITVTAPEGGTVAIAGLAIAPTELGSLQGQKWNDLDGDGGAPEPGETGLPGYLIYLDQNNNGILDRTPEGVFAQSAPEVPQPLGDYSTVKNDLVFNTAGTIVDVNITVSLTHTFDGDLTLYLIGPDGTRVKLVAHRGGNGDNFTNTTFDDSAATAIASVTNVMAPFTGSFKPEELLSAFNGRNSAGKWSLEINDGGPGDTGDLIAWSLEITVSGSILEPYQISDASGNYSFTNLKPGLYYVREEIQNSQLAAGWRQSWAAPPVTVTSGGEIAGVDFGHWIPVFNPSSIHGQVWLDSSNDGIHDPGEQGLEGWIVYVDSNNNGVRDISTTPTTISATGLPKPITDFSTLTSSITVGNLGAVLSVEVTLDITHSFMADLDAYLTSPSGRIVELFTGVGSQFNDFHNITFADDAARSIDSINQSDLPYTGVWRPEGQLDAFFDDASEGVWTLTIRDTQFADAGTLNSWSISITSGERFDTTDADGNYSIDDLPPGQYIVREDVQSGWTQTAPTVGGTAWNLNLGAGQSISSRDFGNFSAVPELLGDFNRDGLVDSRDYILYRKTAGASVTNAYDGADGNGDRLIGPEDLAVWNQNYGKKLDDFGNTVAEATVVSLPGSVSGKIEVVGDIDAFSFQAVSGTSYHLAVPATGLSDPSFYLLDTNGADVLRFGWGGVPNAPAIVDWEAPATGTYFVAVQSNGFDTGAYQLSISENSGGGGGGVAFSDFMVQSANESSSVMAIAEDDTQTSKLVPVAFAVDISPAVAVSHPRKAVRMAAASSRDAALVALLNMQDHERISGRAWAGDDSEEALVYISHDDISDDGRADQADGVDALFELLGA